MALNRLRGLPYFEQKPFIQQAAALASKIKPLNDRNQEEEQQGSRGSRRLGGARHPVLPDRGDATQGSI